MLKDTLSQKSFALTQVAGAQEQSQTVSREIPNVHLQTAGELKIYAVSADSECKNKLAISLMNTNPKLLPDNLSIELTSNPNLHGVASANAIKLNCELTQPRFTRTFFHELGHVHYFLISENNPFAKSVPKYGMGGAPNYLTEYSTTNEHEDFAESFAMYFTNRKLFLQKTAKSKVLKAKYEFIESYVLSGIVNQV
ncbi:MAG: hypothetical protein U1D98_05425 [Candidatus Gracilibacteria bacterium]|nr:hypothetical protein [Candidatus Gracilibacteria bacterium]